MSEDDCGMNALFISSSDEESFVSVVLRAALQ